MSRFRDIVKAELVNQQLPAYQYMTTVTRKDSVCLHHTASGRGSDGDFTHWLNTPQRIATCVIVDYKGVIHQCFSSSYWAHHLGIKQKVFDRFGLPNINQMLNVRTIGIEIDAWGGLKEKDGKFYAYPNDWTHEVPKERVVELAEPYRGYKYYERYTDEQIETVRQLLLYWHERYGIDLSYNWDMWEVSHRALRGEKGIWTHNSYRPDKSDCFPQKELVQMLKEL